MCSVPFSSGPGFPDDQSILMFSWRKQKTCCFGVCARTRSPFIYRFFSFLFPFSSFQPLDSTFLVSLIFSYLFILIFILVLCAFLKALQKWYWATATFFPTWGTQHYVFRTYTWLCIHSARCYCLQPVYHVMFHVQYHIHPLPQWYPTRSPPTPTNSTMRSPHVHAPLWTCGWIPLRNNKKERIPGY